ncbi:class I adenylate-forming enzyme family protein (plasmid) [Rhizobium sp. T1470]|uniref:class I adenylate-forming enzyme family protein n=1 Tax=unclassified Rhizobium TaxID=2613769 RepID=UPI001AAE301D|nr:class I adenylate-forming enzyme family protein [Rhizobium sp. T1473]MCA0806506.1 acyl--CoA ligase [Rhizobium sp. T1473]
MNAQWLNQLAQRGDAPAIIENELEISYRELARRIVQMVAELSEAGVKPGDTVVLNGDHSLPTIAALFALASLRAVAAPITTLTPVALETMRQDCGARYLYRSGGDPELEALEGGPSHPLQARLRAADAAGLVLVSSGSTGKPKAILHNLDSLLIRRKAARPGRGLRILLLLMFDHIGGINTLINTLFSGGTAVVVAKRTPATVCQLISDHQVQILPGNPTFLNLILMGRFHERFDLSSLRLITYGTEPMPAQLLLRIRAAFPKTRLLQTFGTSETGIARTQSASSESTRFRIADSDYKHRIVDGELWLRSKTQFLGYLNNSTEAVTDDGWFRTGDLVEAGEDGYLTILGRAKEVINVGGEKVLPLDLESLLLEHPLVADCVVYGAANAITGQMVCADIQPTRSIDKAELRREIHGFLKDRVERFKLPGRIRLVEAVEASERFKKLRTRA